MKKLCLFMIIMVILISCGDDKKVVTSDDNLSDADTANTGDTKDTKDPGYTCGNGVIEEGEECERFQTKPCEEVGETWYPINEATCNSFCTGWDTYTCIDINDLTCYQVYECVGECSDSICEEECFAKTWPAAKSKYDTMLECYDTKCPERKDDCIKENCKYQTDACKTHITCGNEKIDQYEVCENADTIDCGDIKDKGGEAIYEAGTANAFCNPNCTEWSGMLCFKFCSCSAIKNCVATNCGEYATADSECVKECEDLGSYEGKNQHKAWRTWIESCSSDGQTGFDSQNCIDKGTEENPCEITTNDKCEYEDAEKQDDVIEEPDYQETTDSETSDVIQSDDNDEQGADEVFVNDSDEEQPDEEQPDEEQSDENVSPEKSSDGCSILFLN